MNVTTKYDIGDKVFIMFNNKICITSIIGWEIKSGTKTPNMRGTTYDNAIFYHTDRALDVREGDVFLSKEDALKHIDETAFVI